MKLPSWVTSKLNELTEKDSLRENSKGNQGKQSGGYVSFGTPPTSSGDASGSGLNSAESGRVSGPGPCDKEMARCLTTVDVVSLGVGSCCGAGMYLTAGIVASSLAGPAGVFAFALAGLASLLSGVHFAKLSALFPHTSGSAYMYTYATVGEFCAFIIGWGLVVEYMVGTAAAAVALSETINSLFQGAISAWVEHSCTYLPNFDPVAGAVTLLLTCVLATGVELSAKVNNLLNLLNFLVWATFIAASLALGDFTNWTRGRGVRGFFPYGTEGVWKAVPVAYFAFIGFDGLAATGAECKTPGRSIPAGIVLSILINTVVFITVVLGLTMDVNYRSLPDETAMVDVFPMMGYQSLKYVLAVGAVSGLFAATFGSLFPLPRVVQAMAQDGLIFRWFSHIHPTRHTAMRATLIMGAIAALLAATVNLNFLIELVLIGTLLAYVIVTFAVVFIRYVDIDHGSEETTPLISVQPEYGEGERGAGQYGFDSPQHQAKDNHGKHRSKLRLSDSEASDSDRDDVFSSASLYAETPMPRPRSRSTTEKRETFEASGGLDILGNSTKVPRHSDHSHNDEDIASNFDSHKQIAPSSTDKSTRRDSYGQSQNFQKAGMPWLTRGAACMVTAARLLCDGRHISDFLKLLMFLTRKQITAVLLCIYSSLFVICVILGHLPGYLSQVEPITTVVLTLSAGVAAVCTLLLILQPQVKRRPGILAALSPLVSIFTAFINLYLMANLRPMTWCLFLAWMVLGLSIYYLYGRRPSWLSCSERKVSYEGTMKQGGETSPEARTMVTHDKAPLIIQ